MTSAASARTALFYARLVGVIYLVAMALSIFSTEYITSQVVVPADAAATAHKLVAHEGLFRLGIAVDAVIFVSDVLIAWAFYELLRGVDRGLALLGALLRTADAAILAVSTVSGLVALRLVSGADYLQVFSVDQLHGLARFFIGIRGLGYYIGFVFLGLGSTVFAYLLYRSRYVPRVLAAWGVVASLALALGSLAVIGSSWFFAHASTAYMIPMFFYEVPLGLWFLIRGVATPKPAADG